MWRFCAISVAAAAVCPPVPAEMQLLQTNFQLSDARPAILKRIVFTRHGESTWLVAKRNGQILNNVFDANLSERGIDDALALDAWIKTGARPAGQSSVPQFSEHVRSVLRGETLSADKILLLASNLKRAQLTGWIALNHILHRNPRNKMYVLSALQEVSSSMAKDAVPLAGKGEAPAFTHLGHRVDASRFNACNHKGNLNVMPLYATDDLERFSQFCKWLSMRSEVFVAAFGHSSWIRSFFKSRLEESASRNVIETRLLREKISPGGMIEFDLLLNADGTCKILAGSTSVVFGDFAN